MQTIIYPSKKIAVLFYDDTRRGIIRELRFGSKTVSLLAKSLNKRKSTIVHHIDVLKREGIVEEVEIRPVDRREKPYRLSSIIMRIKATNQDECRTMMTAVEDQLKGLLSLEEAESRVKLFVSLFRAVRISSLVYGVDTDEILLRMGYMVGEHLSINFCESNLGELMRSIAVFWSRNRLGEMAFKASSPNSMEVIVYECYECAGMPNIGRTLCAFDAGLIGGLIGKRLGMNVKVVESECWGTGYRHCKFMVSIGDSVES